jgi:hypothetical protein
MNPDYLLKVELETELRVCAIPSFGDVSLLRERVRSAVSSFLPSQPEIFCRVTPKQTYVFLFEN